MRFPSSAAILALLASSTRLCAATDAVDFSAKIAPLFEEHCNDCHAADDPDGELNLETFASLIKGGKAGKVITPGNAQDSLLVKFIEGRSGKEGKNRFMPPGKKEHLTPAEIALIRQWIDAGAPPPATEAKIADVLANLPKIAPVTDRKKAIQALAYSPKTGLIAVGSYASAQLIDAATRQPRGTLEGIAGKVNALVFSPDGSTLFVAAGDAGIGGIAYQWRVDDPAHAQLARKFEGHKDALYALALSPDGETLATGSYDQKIKLWNVETGAEIKTLSGHNGAIFGLSFRPDGKVLASASADRTVKLWDVASGKRLDTFSQPLKEQTAVAFAPDGATVAAGGMDNRIRVWSVSANAEEGTNPLRFTRYAHEGALLNLIFSADGSLIASGAADRTVKLWSASDLTERHLLEPQPDWTPALALISGGQLALGRLDGSLAFYDTATGKPAQPPKPMAETKAEKKPAMPAVPVITRIEPGGLQSGATANIRVTGRNLAGIKEVKFSGSSLHATVISINPAGTVAEIAVAADAGAPRAQVEMSVVTPAGASAGDKVFVDSLPQIVAASPQPTALTALPVNIWGTLAATGQTDQFHFSAKKGQTIVFDLAAKRIGSKAQTPRLEILDDQRKLIAANNGLDSNSDPFIAFTAPGDGEYTARVLEITLEGSPNHSYRLTVGELPYVTGWWPLSVPANQESQVHLVGPNLKTDFVTVKAGADGEITLPLDSDHYRGRVAMRVAVSSLPESLEQEPNDTIETAQPLTVPASVNGRLLNPRGEGPDADLYRIDAEQGEQLVIETRAASFGSPADTKIEVLDAKGEPVPRMLLQATKDSWLTLRSSDSNNAGIRLGQFTEMALNDYMYFNGEVVKILRLARGPDADMVYYMRNGLRRDYFDTSASGHGLDEPCYVVEPKPVGAKIVANGLPVFTLYYVNDDDAERELGKDSRLHFTAPAKGRYIIRVSDTRGWSGERFAYRLIVRRPEPDFTASLVVKTPDAIPAGSGQQFIVKANRTDGFDGDVRVDISGLPPGFYASTPLVVQAAHLSTAGCLYALPDAKPGATDFGNVKITATATVNGKAIVKEVTGFPKITVAAPPKQMIFMEPDIAGKPEGNGKTAPTKPYEITIAPGGRVSAWLRVDRHGNEGLLALDVEGLPHGVIVDSIGLNGVQIRANENEREIFLSCDSRVPEQDRLCQVVAGSVKVTESIEGLQSSFPVLLKVRKPAPVQTASAK